MKSLIVNHLTCTNSTSSSTESRDSSEHRWTCVCIASDPHFSLLIFSQAYPSLTPESIQHLKVLSQGHQQPNDEVMSTWAILLKANILDIRAWVMDNLHHHSEEPLKSFQMPTPHNSISPEPLAPKAKLQQKEIHVLYQKVSLCAMLVAFFWHVCSLWMLTSLRFYWMLS